MSVSDTFTLPDNPPTGLLSYVPLGGDGYTDPFAMYALRNFLVIGDATGGASTLTVVMDDRFCSMVSYASVIASGVNVNPTTVRWGLGSAVAGQTPQMFRQRVLDLGSILVSPSRLTDTWLPPAFLLPGADFSSLSCAVPNEDTDVQQIFCAIFLYNINARQKVPYSHLVQARGGVGDGN